MNKQDVLLKAPVRSALLKISVPIILANVLRTLYSFIDLFWVGRLGTDAVAALGSGFPIIFLFMSVAIGLVSAGGILVAQYNGKKDAKTVSLVAGQTFTFITLVIIGLISIGELLLPYVLPLLTSNTAIYVIAFPYIQIVLLSLIPMFVFAVTQTVFRSVGEVKIPFFIVLFTVVLNFILDPIFMNGWKFIPPLGIIGIAWVTVGTNVIAALIGFSLLMKTARIELHLADFYPQAKWIKKLVTLGIPTSLEMSARSIGSLLLTGFVSTFGTLTLAAFSLGGQVFSFVIIPAVGLAIGVAALVGNNLGANQIDRVKQTVKLGMKFGFVALTLLGVVLFISAKSIMSFFAPGQIELIAVSSQFIRIMALTFGFIGVQMPVIGALRASGRTVLALIMAVSTVIILFITALLLANIYGATGIWTAYAVTNVLSFGIVLYFYYRKDWLVLKE